ncbi:MAG: penicillin acylase family protein [Myxococcales bacterium]|nr:penicillin acylase family protein [Myxococcales bacterium]
MRHRSSHRSVRRFGSRIALAIAVTGAIIMAGCGSENPEKSEKKPTSERGLELPNADDYSATIRWTSHGVPHVTGETLGDAIFGQAFANAKLNVCTTADIVVMANSQRASYMGKGDGGKWLESDFAHRALGVRKRAEASWAKMSETGRAAIIAYTAGHNHYIDVTPDAEIPARCRGEAWLKPITPIDLTTWYLTLALQAGSRNFAQYIGLTRAPGDEWTANQQGKPARTQVAQRTQFDWLGRYTDFASDIVGKRVFRQPPEESIGSNGWGVGGDLSDNGKGMVLGNPHFPWFGELRFYENHIKVTGDPDFGKVNAYGASLLGIPGVQIGFTEKFGWTHTVSFSAKFTVYKLKLKKGDPLTYVVDGEERKISGRKETVQVKQEDGSMKTVERTYYRSEVGVMIALPAIGEWTAETAYTLRDANENNIEMLDHFIQMDTVQSVAEAKKVLADVQGMPWVNILGADADGNALYSDACAEPNLSKAATDQHAKTLAEGDFLTGFAFDLGAFLLDGSKKFNDWVVDPAGAREDGLVPCSKVPLLERKDYVANANQSHWLTNSAKPLTGFGPAFGTEETVRSLRTRIGLHLLTNKGDKGAMGTDGKFSLDELQAVVDDGWTMGAVLLADQVVDLCKQVTSVTLEGKVVETEAACTVLSQWDRRYKADSKGAVLFREWLTDYSDRDSSGALWKTGFDLKKPVSTPNTLKITDKDPTKTRAMFALARAVRRLNTLKIKLDTTLGAQQYTLKDGKRLPVPGAFHGEGAFNVIGWSAGRDSTTYPKMTRPKVVNSKSGLTSKGYAINYGTSFVMALQFTADGPKAKTLVTYSQSAEADSPWHSDQTKMFAARKWKPALFTEAAIAADPKLQVETVPKK